MGPNPCISRHYINADTARELTHNYHEYPKLLCAAFDKIRSAAEVGLYSTSIDLDFIQCSIINMSEAQCTLRNKIIEELENAGFKIESKSCKDSSPSINVSWYPKEIK